ncbi:MAG: SAF domain-containing protein [Deltaproteobacteria bacterium]
MNFQRIKSVLILIIAISAIAGITYFITVSAYLPKIEEEITDKKDKEFLPTPVVVASRDIPAGAVISAEDVTSTTIPFKSIVDATKTYTIPREVIGKIASINIYKSEQILKDKLIPEEMEFSNADWEKLKQVPTRRKIESSSRYITVDIPKYNFVNERVGVGSLVDILIDKGQGKYQVVIPKIAILDKVPMSDGSNSADAQQNVNVQIKRPLPKPLLMTQQEQAKSPFTEPQLLYQNNPAMEESQDYRVTIMVTEKEQKRLFEAMTYGKLMLRKYVFPNQPESIFTFTGEEQNSVVGDGTKKYEEPKPATPIVPTVPVKGQ